MRAGSRAGPALVAVVLAALVAAWFLVPRAGPPAGAAPRARTPEPAPAATGALREPRTHPGGSGLPRERSGDPRRATVGAAAPGPLEPAREASGSTGVDLEAVLASFHGTDPRVDELQEAVHRLAEGASVVADSVREESGAVVGELELPAAGAVGTFRVDAAGVSVDLPPAFDTGTARMRTCSIRLEADGGAVRSGRVAVQHQLDVRSAAVLDRLPESGEVTGWVVQTDLESGTEATPVLTRRTGPGEVSVGPARDGEVAAIRQEWDWDLSGYERWRALLAPYAPR